MHDFLKDIQDSVDKVFTYDCTLRDGEQCLGISLSLEDKLAIAQKLDSFGIDYIEGGFPASNPKDLEFFKRAQKLKLTHASLVAFGTTCKKDTSANKDAGLAGLLKSGARTCVIVGKTWDKQVECALQTTLEENLRMISDSVSFLVSKGCKVFFDAEHFFDGYRDNCTYALSCLTAAVKQGAEMLVLCDTNGASLPLEIEDITRKVAQTFPEVTIAIHAHNDIDCAVANSLAATQAGAKCVQGTICGIGERAGNANLLSIIANLELKMAKFCVGRKKLRELTNLADFVAELCNVSVPAHMAYVGSAAFAHKGGLHASAIARYERAYEHISPEVVGNKSKLLVSELAGKASLISKAKSFGFDLSDESAQKAHVQEILDDIKKREAAGYSYEVADGSLALLIARHLGKYQPRFTLESFRVIVDDHEDTGAFAKDAASEATIKIHVGSKRFVATGEGTGPVGALDAALRQAITEFFPEVAGMELVDYKVRILDENVGCGATTRVTITTRDKTGSWGTVGVSENIIEASWNALVDSIEYGLSRSGK